MKLKTIVNGAGAVLLCAALYGEGHQIALFDGKTLKGWHLAAKPEDMAKAQSFWSVQDGAIVCDTAGDREHDYIWLVSDEEYDDFELTFEVRNGDNKGNSGVQVRSRYDYKARWLNGPQVDIASANVGWRNGYIYDETEGVKHWIHPELPSWRIEETHAVEGWSWNSDDWNTMRIRCEGTRIETETNGVLISAYDGSGVLDDAPHKLHKVGMKGHIALQLHRGDDLSIAFRNIRLVKLAHAAAGSHSKPQKE